MNVHRRFNTSASRATLTGSIKTKQVSEFAPRLQGNTGVHPVALTTVSPARFSSYYVQAAGLDEGECYSENDAPIYVLCKFESALDANRTGAASIWKSAVRLLRTSPPTKRPASYCSMYVQDPRSITYPNECFLPERCHKRAPFPPAEMLPHAHNSDQHSKDWMQPAIKYR